MGLALNPYPADALRNAVIQAIRRRNDFDLKQWIDTISRTLGFGGARAQALKFKDVIRSGWKRSRSAEDPLPEISAQLWYVRRIADKRSKIMNGANAAKKTTAKTSAAIPPRHMDSGFATADFSSAEISRYYLDNNPLSSAILTALSPAIPDGERFFVDSVRHFRHLITDPELNAQISGFIGQEAFHAREHDAFNLALVAQGLPVDQLERVFRVVIRLMQRCPKKFQLAG